jgi:hypothetical protein
MPGNIDNIIDLLIRSGMGDDAIADEIGGIEAFGVLNDMRENSRTGNMGRLDQEELYRLMEGMGQPVRKRMSPEEIHNLGVMYKQPINQSQIDWYEDALNTDPNGPKPNPFPPFFIGDRR